MSSKCVLTPRVVAAVIAAARRARKPIVGELGQALRHAVKNDEAAVRAAALALADEVVCEIVLVTRANGAGSSFHATARRHHSMPPQGGSSTCPGTGDTVVASFALALVSEAGIHYAGRLANVAAGVVVGKKGTSQVTADEWRDLLLSRPHFELRQKIKDMEAVQDCVAAWRREGLTIGFTNGCFDLLHPGHLQAPLRGALSLRPADRRPL